MYMATLWLFMINMSNMIVKVLFKNACFRGKKKSLKVWSSLSHTYQSPLWWAGQSSIKLLGHPIWYYHHVAWNEHGWRGYRRDYVRLHYPTNPISSFPITTNATSCFFGSWLLIVPSLPQNCEDTNVFHKSFYNCLRSHLYWIIVSSLKKVINGYSQIFRC